MKKLAFLLAIALSTFGTIEMLKPAPTHAAERISFSIPILGEFYLSVESLEIFAREGKITPEFAYFAKRLDAESLENFRQILQTNFDVEPITMYRLTNLPMGEDSLKRMGKVVYTHPQRNGMYAIRAALILGATEPDGLNAINFLRHFPGEEIQLDAKLIPSLAKETKSFLRYVDTTVKAIAEQAATEIKTQSAIDLESLPDLDRAGPYQVEKQKLTFTVEELRQTHKGFLSKYELNTDIYLPISFKGTAPLAIITHGFGAKRADFAYLAEHLASHGYIVAVPVHSGSDRQYKDAYLNGEVGVDLSPIEFYSRPRDITHLLDRLEQHPNFQQQINWSQVGIIGHSLGGTTALTASGAPINLARINHTCQQDRFNLNISVILQCRANNLPPRTDNLQDKRIKAVIALNPVTSSILGPESIKQVEIPTLILGGSGDYIAPFIPEQAHPFLWLTTAHKYLVTVVNGSHFSTPTNGNIAGIFDLSQSVPSSHGQKYIKALSLAFLEAHTRDRPGYQAYLTAAYGKKISNPKLPLHLVRSLTPEQLASAYGDTPPIPPLPEPLDITKPLSNPQLLTEIKQTETPKVAMRKDAAPFAYTDKNRNWVGYRAALTAALSDRLTEELATSQAIKVVKVPSTFSLNLITTKDNNKN